MRVLVETSDRYNWALGSFAYLFNIYWSEMQPVMVAGYSRPNINLPGNFQFYSIDRQNYPPERWSDGMIRALRAFDDTHFVFMMADYWLVRTVDVEGIESLYQYARKNPDILRIDLTDDRQYAGGRKDVGYWGHYDLIETGYGTPYQMSFQSGIWNRKLLLSVMQPGKSAWETEIHIQPPETMRVLGTRQRPMRYANAILKGKLDLNQVAFIPDEHKEKVLGRVPNDFR